MFLDANKWSCLICESYGKHIFMLHLWYGECSIETEFGVLPYVSTFLLNNIWPSFMQIMLLTHQHGAAKERGSGLQNELLFCCFSNDLPGCGRLHFPKMASKISHPPIFLSQTFDTLPPRGKVHIPSFRIQMGWTSITNGNVGEVSTEDFWGQVINAMQLAHLNICAGNQAAT